MTGWGQEGPYSGMAGHDINYIALSGTLVHDRPGRPGAGPAAQPDRRLRRRRHAAGLRRGVRAAGGRAGPDEGQVIDAAMVDGAALLAAMIYGMLGQRHVGGAGHATSSTPAPGTTTSTRRPTASTSRSVRWSRSSSEEMLRITGLAEDVDGRGPMPDPTDRATWPAMKERMAAVDEDPHPGRVVRAARRAATPASRRC